MKLQMLERARKLRELRKYREESDIFRRILKEYGPDDMVMYRLARAWYTERDPDGSLGRESLDLMRQAIALNPNQPEYHCALGWLLSLAAVEYEAAIKPFRRALELEPSYEPALWGLASLEGVPENVITLDEAIAAMEKAVRVLPTRSGWRRLADLYERAGRMSDKDRALAMSLLESREVTEEQ